MTGTITPLLVLTQGRIGLSLPSIDAPGLRGSPRALLFGCDTGDDLVYVGRKMRGADGATLPVPGGEVRGDARGECNVTLETLWLLVQHRAIRQLCAKQISSAHIRFLATPSLVSFDYAFAGRAVRPTMAQVALSGRGAPAEDRVVLPIFPRRAPQGSAGAPARLSAHDATRARAAFAEDAGRIIDMLGCPGEVFQPMEVLW